MTAQVEKVTVRPVEVADATDLRKKCFSANSLAEVQARIADQIAAFAEGREVLLVAEVNGVVVGTGTLVRQSHPLYAHRGELAGLVVHPAYQRRGIARQITEHVCAQSKVWGLEILEVGCRGGTPAEEVYARLGFVECGRLPGGIKEPWGAQRVYDDVSLYMPLGQTSKPERSGG